MDNAAIVEQHGYAYLNMPKAACTSIKEAIGQQLGHDAIWLREESGFYQYAKILLGRTDLWRWTVVRHPGDRLVSCWQEIQNPRDAILQLNSGLRNKVGLSFADFVLAVAREDDWRANHHYRQQWHLCTYRGIRLFDAVFRFDRLSESWPTIQEATGLGDLPHLRKSEHAPWQTYYTDDLKQIVLRRYADDFREFGFEW